MACLAAPRHVWEGDNMAADTIMTYADYREDPRPALSNADAGYRDWLLGIWADWQDGEPPADSTSAGEAPVMVNGGRWLWLCPGCLAAYPVEPGAPGLCGICGSGWYAVTLPADRADIEAELLKQPGHRSHAPVREWRPDWPDGTLEARTAKAHGLQAAGVSPILRLSLTVPHLYVANSVLFASQLNSNRSVLQELAGRDGRVDVENAIQVSLGATHDTQPYLDLAPTFVGLPNVTTDPTPADGRVIYRSDTDRLRYRRNGAWENVPRNPVPVAEGGTGGTTVITARTGLKIVQVTQAAYDALATPDSETIYIIVG